MMLLIWLVGCRKEFYPTDFFKSGLSVHIFISKHWTLAQRWAAASTGVEIHVTNHRLMVFQRAEGA